MKRVALTLALCAVATTAAAQNFRAVTDQAEFVALMAADVTHRLYNLTLDVAPNGQIAGSAMGWDVTGTWSWQNGFFCRELDWGGDPIPYNCQLVEVAGDEVRFTSDQGAGQSASFRLR